MPWRDAPEPFASSDDFWVSVAASVDALITLLVASVLTIVFGPPAALVFLIPMALLLRAAGSGRRSGRFTRTRFATRDAWRDAERQAVWSVLPAALFRPRWRMHRA